MALATGARLGPYGIQSALGAGGMGEVYKARDTRLDRTVAVKVLPEHVATDPELKQRFEGEARTLAALNHPHICHIHDVGSQDGIDFLVMEYLEGETLARRLTKGALPLGQALEVGIQIADALDKAHRQRIVHRDLKPGNIMLTKGGAKLLDFGLAKHRRPSALGVVASSTTTTQSDPVTVPGTLIGTLAYMAPEQLEGKEADARTDIFAFGAVLYEMITGRRAFEGDNQASLIASVLKSKPTALSVLQPMTPPALDHVVERCLERDPDDRWQTASDVMREVRWAATAGTVLTGIASERRLQRRFGVVVGWAVAAAITTGIVVWSRSQSATPPPHPPIRVTIETEVPIADRVLIGAVSPDGRTVVYVGERDRMRRLYRRSLNSLVSTPIPGTEGAINPFFSPDGQWVGFATTAQLKKVALGGGAPVTLCDVPLSAGGSWGLDGSIVFGQATGGLMQISDAGGAPRALTASDSDADAAHWFPQILPGGRAVLFLARTGGIAGVISVLNLDTGQQKRLVEGTQPRFVSPGHIVFAREDSLWAMPFDLDRLDVVGQGFPVLEGIRLNTGGVADFAVGDDGTLIYVAGELTDSTLVWVDRNGREVPAQIAAPLEAARFPRLSPDGRRLAIVLGRRGEGRLWIYDLQGQPPTKLTFEGDALAPVWAPSGERLIFSSWLSQPKRQFWSSPLLSVAWGAPNASSTDPVTTDGYHHPHAFAPDGREIIFTAVDNRGSGDIMALELGTRAEARTVVQSFANEGRGGAALSADGRWLVYTSDVTAREEVWVRPYPAPGAPQRISPNGGREPVWSRGSRELFYLEGDKMMAVAIDINASLRFKPPMMLFEQQYAGRQGQPPSYDVAADGRFLMIKSSQDTVGIRKLVVIINWLEELKRLVPVN